MKTSDVTREPTHAIDTVSLTIILSPFEPLLMENDPPFNLGRYLILHSLPRPSSSSSLPHTHHRPRLARPPEYFTSSVSGSVISSAEEAPSGASSRHTPPPSHAYVSTHFKAFAQQRIVTCDRRTAEEARPGKRLDTGLQ